MKRCCICRFFFKRQLALYVVRCRFSRVLVPLLLPFVSPAFKHDFLPYHDDFKIALARMR